MKKIKAGEYEVIKGERLNDKERDFAAEHIGLLYAFLRRKALDEREYFDLAAIGYVEAVLIFFRKKKEELPFSAIAFKRMNGKVFEYWRYLYSVKRGSGAVDYSLYREIYDDDIVFLEKLNADDDSIQLYRPCKPDDMLIVKDFERTLNLEELFVLKMLLLHKNKPEISSELKISLFKTNNLINSLRAKWGRYCE